MFKQWTNEQKFRRSYTYNSLFSFKPKTVKYGLLFWLVAHCWKRPFPFCCCLSVTIVHLRNLFLLSTLVAQMLLTSRWVKQTKRWEIFIDKYMINNKQLMVKHFISHRKTFSLNPIIPILQRRQSIFLSLHLDVVLIELHCNMLLQRPKYYIPLKLACCFFVAYCHDLWNRKMTDWSMDLFCPLNMNFKNLLFN